MAPRWLKFLSCHLIYWYYSYFCCRPCLPSLQNICTCSPALSMFMQILVVNTLLWNYIDTISTGMPTFLTFRFQEGKFLLMLRIEYLKYYPCRKFCFVSIPEFSDFLIHISENADATNRCRSYNNFKVDCQ